VDNILNKLDKRFIDNSNILCGVSAFHPKASFFLEYDLIVPLANHYSCDIASLEAELALLVGDRIDHRLFLPVVRSD